MAKDEPRWLIRHNELARAMSLSPAQLTRMVADGTFPLPIEYTPGVRGGAKAYLIPEVIGWVKARISRRDKAAADRAEQGYSTYAPDDEAADPRFNTSDLIGLMARLRGQLAPPEDEAAAA